MTSAEKPVPDSDHQPTTRQLLALREAMLAVSADLSLTETLKHIVVAAAKLANARYAALGVPNESGDYLAEFVTTGMTVEEEARISYRPRGHGLLGVVMREGQVLRLKDLTQHPRAIGFPAHHPVMHSFLGVPITYKGRLCGNLYLTDKIGADEFTAEDQTVIEMLAAQAAISIENARLHLADQRLRVIEERQRIGMDLHDGVIQSIYAVGLTLEYVAAQLHDGDATGADQRLKSAVDALNSTIRDIRAYILDLHPRRFDGQDLITGLERLLAEFKANTLMRVELNADPLADQALAPETRLALFHIAQEALSNAARHSRASRVLLQLTDQGTDVVLSLRDNGRGFNLDQAERRMGHGLTNMQDRVMTLGGELLIHSPEGQGTEVRVTIPKSAARRS